MSVFQLVAVVRHRASSRRGFLSLVLDDGVAGELSLVPVSENRSCGADHHRLHRQASTHAETCHDRYILLLFAIKIKATLKPQCPLRKCALEAWVITWLVALVAGFARAKFSRSTGTHVWAVRIAIPLILCVCKDLM